MTLLVIALVTMLAGSAAAACLYKKPGLAALSVLGTTAAAAILGCIPAIGVLLSGRELQMHHVWQLPGASLSLGVDALSAFFLVPVLILSAAGALYGYGYTNRHRRAAALCWALYGLLCASMVGVVIARNGVLFLLAWELMALSSLGLVLFEHRDEPVRTAGWIYGVASHIGVALLMAMFLLLALPANNLDFSAFAGRHLPGVGAAAIFLCALTGFGLKAGFAPLHVWLPLAHPAAPSHVSALMSGVMIKMGIYGLMRVLTFLPTPPLWWGLTLLLIGMAGSVLGILNALGQSDLKRILAFSSVENIGIIAMGCGIGLIGQHSANPLLAAAGFGAALVHVVNHAFIKGLLFMAAGSVVHATGSRDIERFGGLSHRLPHTARLFLIGSAAICGLPLLNGFISEFMVCMAAITAVMHQSLTVALAGLGALGALALTGGLAVAAFARLYGIAFLGEPRDPHIVPRHEAPLSMRCAMYLLAGLCLALTAGFAAIAPQLLAPLHQLAGSVDTMRHIATLQGWIIPVQITTAAIAGLILIISFLRAWQGRCGTTRRAPTWDCGYARPHSRMQYSASSFAQPITGFFSRLLRPHTTYTIDPGWFPARGQLHEQIDDQIMTTAVVPLFSGINRQLRRLHWLQSGKVNMYVLYIAGAGIVTLLAVFLIG